MESHTPHWPLEEPKNIVVRMPNWIGDLVMGTPVLADLRKRFPNAKITAMCQSNVATLLKSDPNIDEVFSFKRPSGWIHRSQHLAIADELRCGQYDLGVLLTNSLSSAWWFWRGKVKNRIGYSNIVRNLFLNKAAPLPKNIEKQHLVITYKMILEPLGIPVSNTKPKLYISPEEKEEAYDFLSEIGLDPTKQIIIGINPGAAYGSAKCWLPERYQAVTQRLLENPKIVVLYFGDQAGLSLVNEICKKLPERVINLAGKTSIRSLMALMAMCSVLLTNDSGPMHMAAALDTPLLALFGSTSDAKTGPYGIGKVIHKHVACSPCYKRECPIDFRCMTRITVEEVYKEIQNLL